MQEVKGNNFRKKVSIILPVYNGEKYLDQAIKSILQQTYKNFELIIVNDCSTDKTTEIIKHYAKLDSRIIVINNEVNKKLPASLNIGHNVATGNYITWTSHDNLLKPNFIERLLEAILNNQSDIVFSNYDMIDGNNKIFNERITGPLEHLLFGNTIGASFLYRSSVFINIKFNEALFLLEDYDFWLRASLRYKFCHVNENLYQYRFHNESLTSHIFNLKSVKKQHQEGSVKLFNEFSKNYDWNESTYNLIISIRLNKTILINDYIKNKVLINSDILKLTKFGWDENKLSDSLLFVLRGKLISDKKNQNFKTLVNILYHERKLLFHNTFSKKKSLKFVYNCFFKV